MERIGVIGAGISGMSIGQLCKKEFAVELLEKSSAYGGIAKVRDVNGVPYHLTGGHCFNSKINRVLQFVFEDVLAKREWNHIERRANIHFHDNFIDYPIEFSIKQIFDFDVELATKIVLDFIGANNEPSDNLEEWLVNQFGETLAGEYFIPYNRKIWGMEPSAMSSSWVLDKLPQTNKQSFIKGILEKNTDSMPHRHFYYPKSGTMKTFHDALAYGLNIRTNYTVKDIYFDGRQWHVNGENVFDKLIYTGSLKDLPSLIKNVPVNIENAADHLKVNKITNMLWETKPGVNSTWTYFPSNKSLFHRNIHIGNFIRPVKNMTIVESIGEKSREEMVLSGKSVPYLQAPIEYNIGEMGYVVFDKNYQAAVSIMREYFNQRGFYLLGRFASWEYYNMDICIDEAIKLKSRLIVT